jgi:hypothetical protein
MDPNGVTANGIEQGFVALALKIGETISMHDCSRLGRARNVNS